MQVSYRGYARRRMRERHVTEADVERALAQFVERSENHAKNSVRYKGPGVSGKMLKVWVFPDAGPGDDKRVKTVAWEGDDA